MGLVYWIATIWGGAIIMVILPFAIWRRFEKREEVRAVAVKYGTKAAAEFKEQHGYN